jgi:hypothetical protein
MQMQSHIQVQTTSTEQAQPRKLVLKKETLRQLTTQELRLVGGGTGTSIAPTGTVSFTDPTQTEYP